VQLEIKPIKKFFTIVKKGNSTFIGLVAVCVFLSFASDRFFTPYNFINILRQVSIKGIMAVGMTFVIISGGIDLSVGSVFAFCGVLGVSLVSGGTSIWLSIIITLIVGIVIGILNGLLVGKVGMPAFIVTLGTMTIFRGLSYLYTGGRSITCTVDAFRGVGGGYLGPIPLPVLYLIGICAIFSIILRQTRFGRYIIAVGGNEEAAYLSGINVPLVKICAFAIMGLTSAISGIILTSRLASGQPIAGIGYELDVIAAVVLGGTSLAGGKGTVIGSLIGALLIGVMNNGLNLMGLSFFYQQVVGGLIILIAVFINIKSERN